MNSSDPWLIAAAMEKVSDAMYRGSNRPASRAPEEPNDWVSLAIMCGICLAAVVFVFALVMAWPLL